MDRRKGLIASALTLLLTCLLCLGLYHWDNKYTRQDIQPINGVLFPGEDMAVSCLIRQWVLYPDVLLTPETVDHYEGYRCYTDIGAKKLQGTGSMTYRLTLMLSESPGDYALELPEIFSSCKLYINETLYLQLGDPDAKTEGISSQIVTFSAAGKTELLLSASDFSGISRGMTYPPVFGPVQDVLALRVGRLLLHAAMVLLALLGALLSGSFLFQSNKKRGLLSVLMCLCLAVVTGYPLYHGLFITGVQPLYTLEPSCYYGLLLLAVLLQGELYALSTKHKCIISLPCAAGLFFTLIRYGTAALLPAGIGLLFSLISEFLKYYTAAVLLGLSFWALWREKYHSGLMLCGAVAFAACLIVDRLFPVYEPICGGWFGEVGGVLLALSLAAALWLDAVESYRFRLTYQESFLQMQRRLDMQKEHYNQLSDQVRLAREASHDLRHHMRTMRTFAQQAQWDRLNQYLCDYESHVKTRDITLWSAHPAADAVLNHYAAIAEELDAVYDVRLTIPPELPLPDSELCILLGNLLENATEALARQTEGPRQLYLRGEVVNGRLGIVVDNTFSGQVRQQNGIYLSTKHSSHGLGLSSVTTIVEKHGGLVDFSHNNRLFHASIMIPLPAFRTEELPL